MIRTSQNNSNNEPLYKMVAAQRTGSHANVPRIEPFEEKNIQKMFDSKNMFKYASSLKYDSISTFHSQLHYTMVTLTSKDVVVSTREGVKKLDLKKKKQKNLTTLAQIHSIDYSPKSGLLAISDYHNLAVLNLATNAISTLNMSARPEDLSRVVFTQQGGKELALIVGNMDMQEVCDMEKRKQVLKVAT